MCIRDSYHGQTGAYLSKMPNPALKWEQRMDYNVGADITVHRAACLLYTSKPSPDFSHA